MFSVRNRVDVSPEADFFRPGKIHDSLVWSLWSLCMLYSDSNCWLDSSPDCTWLQVSNVAVSSLLTQFTRIVNWVHILCLWQENRKITACVCYSIGLCYNRGVTLGLYTSFIIISSQHQHEILVSSDSVYDHQVQVEWSRHGWMVAGRAECRSRCQSVVDLETFTSYQWQQYHHNVIQYVERRVIDFNSNRKPI